MNEPTFYPAYHERKVHLIFADDTERDVYPGDVVREARDGEAPIKIVDTDNVLLGTMYRDGGINWTPEARDRGWR